MSEEGCWRENGGERERDTQGEDRVDYAVLIGL